MDTITNRHNTIFFFLIQNALKTKINPRVLRSFLTDLIIFGVTSKIRNRMNIIIDHFILYRVSMEIKEENDSLVVLNYVLNLLTKFNYLCV